MMKKMGDSFKKQDMGKEGNHTKRFLLAMFCNHRITGDLYKFWWRQICFRSFASPCNNVIGGSTSIIFFWAFFGASWEVFNGGISLNSILSCKPLMNSCINST